MDDQAKVKARVDRAKAAGVHETDLALVGLLLKALIESVKEMPRNDKATELSLVVGLATGATIAVEDAKAGAEMVKVLGFMLDEQQAMDHLRRETVRMYLEIRTAHLAQEGRRG